MRSASRISDTAINTVMSLLVQAGQAAKEYEDQHVKNLASKRLQIDEIWSFVGCKAKRANLSKRARGEGDSWTWVCLDADTKLIVSSYVGGRDTTAAMEVLTTARERITTAKVQITSDQYTIYLNTVHAAFMGEADYAQLHKSYGCVERDGRYSPAQLIGTTRRWINGNPDPAHISTSYVERSNLTLRMSNRRFTRLTNGFSKKLLNHRCSVALHSWYYNWSRIHKTLRVTPAMEAGLTDRLWELSDLVKWMDVR